MAEKEPRERIEEELKLVNVLCLALVASVGIYAGMAWYLVDGPGAFRAIAAEASLLVWGGVAVAALLLLVAPVVYRKLLEQAERPSVTGDISAPLAHYRMAVLLSHVLREGAALIGLMIALLSGETLWCYALCGVTVIAMFAGWPRRRDLEEVVGRTAAA